MNEAEVPIHQLSCPVTKNALRESVGLKPLKAKACTCVVKEMKEKNAK